MNVTLTSYTGWNNFLQTCCLITQYLTPSPPHPLTVGPIFILLLAAACCFTVHTQYKLIFTLFQDFSHHPLGIHMKFHHMARCFFVFHGIILCLMLLVGYKHLQQAFPNFSSCRCRHCPQPLPLIQTQHPARG